MKIDTNMAQLVGETHTVYGWSERIGMYAFAAVYNDFAAADVRCVGVEAGIGIPVDLSGLRDTAAGTLCGRDEESLKEGDIFSPDKMTAGHIVQRIERALRKICIKKGIELVNVHITRNPLLLVPSITITGMGRKETYVQDKSQESGSRGCEIVLTKWAGMEGMLRIAREKEDELGRRFAPIFMRRIHSYEKELFAGKELEIARDAKVTEIRQITEGGILAELWKLSKETGRGLWLDMKRMSVLQETIEVCEYYRLNPYQLTSAGSFLMLAEDGGKLTDMMQENQIQASVIGRLTSGKNKEIHNGGDVRYLERPAPDEIYKLFL